MFKSAGWRLPCRSGPPVDGPKDPWPHVLSLPERFVGDPASLARDNIYAWHNDIMELPDSGLWSRYTYSILSQTMTVRSQFHPLEPQPTVLQQYNMKMVCDFLCLGHTCQLVFNFSFSEIRQEIEKRGYYFQLLCHVLGILL